MRCIHMMYDKETMSKLQNVCREGEFNQIVGYENLFDNIKAFVDKDLKSVKTQKDADRIDAYFKWLTDWMSSDLRSQAEYLLKKGVIMNLMEKFKGLSTQMEDMFSEENMERQLKQFQEDIAKRSEYYARENGEDEE